MQTNQELNVKNDERAFTESLVALGKALDQERGAPAVSVEAEVPVAKAPVEARLRKSVLPVIVVLISCFAFPVGVQAQAIRDLPGFKTRSVPRNDDGSSPFVGLPFPINFFGRLRAGCWVNNNGNITFDRALSTFTPFGLESTRTEIIAPFFADVDTRGMLSQLVTYGEDVVNGRAAFGANYINVGYFAQHDEKQNSFQVVLIDRSDTGSGNFDVEFNYARISWETGDASNGVGGLGGVPAAVGWSNGSGGPGTSYQLPGSLLVGAFLDTGPSALARRRLNSPVIGRYLFRARDGQLSPGLSISTGNLLPDARTGSPYSSTLTAEGGTSYRWTLLPDPGQTLPGLTLSVGGILSGTPTAVGSYQFTAVVTSRIDGVDETATQRLTLRVLPAALEISSRSCPLPDATVGVAYGQGLLASGGPGPYMWSWGENGVSPVPGLNLAENGELSGVPSRGGSYNFILRVAGSARTEIAAGSQTCTLNVRQPFQQLTVAACPSEWGTAGVPYAETVRAGGGLAPYRWTALGSLPTGMRLGESGLLSGIPGSTGRFVFGLEVADALGRTGRTNCNLTVGSQALTIENSCPLGTIETGERMSRDLDASGGTAPYSWSLVGAIPPGLTLSAEGQLRGSANAAGSYGFQLVVRDRNGLNAAKPCALSVLRAALSISSCPLPPAKLGQSYDTRLSAIGGSEPLVWSALGSLPVGVSLSSDGRLAGSPTNPGSSLFSLQVRDGNGRTATQQCELFTEPKPLRLLGDCPFADATVGSFYRSHSLAEGGIAPYRFSAEGRLPNGITLGSDGWFSGTPSGPGTTEFTFVVEDARRASTRRTCSLSSKIPTFPGSRLVDPQPSVVAPSRAIPVTLQLDTPYPLPISGTLSITNTPETGSGDAQANRADPAVVFSTNGRRSLNFLIPAGSRTFATTLATSGSVAGTIQTRVERLTVAGQEVTALPGAATVAVLQSPPVLTDACFTVGAGGLNVRLTGFSSTRELKSVTAFLNGAEVKDLNIASYAVDFFGNDLSVRTGGTFQIDLPIPVAASANTFRVESLRITLQNRVGSSTERSARACN